MEKILLAQFIAHFIADFIAQSESMSSEKQNKRHYSRYIYLHALIVLLASLGATFTCSFIGYAFAIAVIHLGIDLLKCLIEYRIKVKKDCKELYMNPTLFFIDQILHLVVIYAAVSTYCYNNGEIPVYLDIMSTDLLLTVAGLLLCMKPANVLIKNCLSSLNLYDETEKGKNDLERAGRWIGTIERIITITLVMLQQYAAIGFIITAKSVLRYNDSRTGKTEYVLIGTLLSFGIALLIGIGIKEGIFKSFLSFLCNNV